MEYLMNIEKKVSAVGMVAILFVVCWWQVTALGESLFWVVL